MYSTNKRSSGTSKPNHPYIFFLKLILIVRRIAKVIWIGLYRIPYKEPRLWLFKGQLLFLCLAFAYFPPKTFGNAVRDIQLPHIIQGFLLLPEYSGNRFLLYVGFSVTSIILVFGFISVVKLLKFQKCLDLLRFGIDESRPTVLTVLNSDDKKTKIKIRSPGLGCDKFVSRKNDLESAFNQTIESICPEEGNPQIISITMSKIPLPKMLPYEEFAKDLTKEGDFLIGQSRQGFIVQNIADLPHLLIAGTTGSGKSVFFKQSLISLLESTPTAEFHLMDFKRGVEFGTFSPIPNVQVIKTKSSALIALKKIKAEMQLRFDYLEASKNTKIDPEKHGKPRIIIAIDEASELLAAPDRFSTDAEKETIRECRNLVNEIAKLGRAACIHIIIATQKVSKSIIDTALQENIGGRMAFRMATLANSTQVLGAKEASDLPEIPGRAIWNFGTKFLEVQVPFLDDKLLSKKIKQIADQRIKSHVKSDPEATTDQNGDSNSVIQKQFTLSEVMKGNDDSSIV